MEFWQTLLIALIPSVITAIISFITSSLLAKRNLKIELTKMKEQHNFELEKMKAEFENSMALQTQQSQTNVATDMISKLMDKVLDSPATQAQIDSAIRKAKPRGKKK